MAGWLVFKYGSAIGNAYQSSQSGKKLESNCT